jgi:hypothetical protein
MAGLSMLLFTGLASDLCDGDCKPRAVLAVLPSFVFFVGTAVLILRYQNTNQIPSDVKPTL